MGEEIKVFIEKDGSVTLNVIGMSGPRCLQTTEAFEREMGNVVDRRRTGEFYQKARNALVGIRHLGPGK
jgi:hypothetical protein